MLKNNRPLSPHLLIYKPQITSVLSILHRATGLVLFFGMLIAVWTINIFSFKTSSLSSLGDIIIFILNNKLCLSLLVIWTYCLFYHMCAGIRYLFWDIDKGMELKTVNITGWVVIFGSIAFTVCFWFFILSK